MAAPLTVNGARDAIIRAVEALGDPAALEHLGALICEQTGWEQLSLRAGRPFVATPPDGNNGLARLSGEVHGESGSAEPVTHAFLVRIADARDEAGYSAAAHEYMVLQTLQLAGVGTPEALCWIESAPFAPAALAVLRLGPSQEAGDPRDDPRAAWGEAGTLLARLHAVTRQVPGMETLPDSDLTSPHDVIAACRSRLDELPWLSPGLEWVYRQFERTAPPREEPVLCLAAVREPARQAPASTPDEALPPQTWERTGWGDPYADLAAAIGPDSLDGETANTLCSAYSAETSLTIDRARLAYWQRLLDARASLVHAAAGPEADDAPRSLLASEAEQFARFDAGGVGGAESLLAEPWPARFTELLEELYGPTLVQELIETDVADDAFAALLKRFCRDIRDGLFDGACAMGVRAIIREYLAWRQSTDQA